MVWGKMSDVGNIVHGLSRNSRTDESPVTLLLSVSGTGRFNSLSLGSEDVLSDLPTSTPVSSRTTIPRLALSRVLTAYSANNCKFQATQELS
jgi:hypothetical protein